MFENQSFHDIGLLRKNIYSEFDKVFSKLIIANISACMKSEEKWWLKNSLPITCVSCNKGWVAFQSFTSL